MENPEQYFLIPKSLDSEAITMGFARIEIIPPLIIGGCCIIVNHQILGISVGAVLFFIIRYFRNRYGANIFNRITYSYLTVRKVKHYYRRIPSYTTRYWRF